MIKFATIASVLAIFFVSPVCAETAIEPNQPLIDKVAAGEWQYYSLTPSISPQQLTVELYQLGDDVDLFVRVGEQPDRRNYDCRHAIFKQQMEFCEMTLTEQTPVYIGVFGYQGGAYKLRASLAEPVATAAAE